MSKNYKPGNTTPQSGQYAVIRPNGKPTGTEITAIQGKPLPPTSKPNQTYVLVDPTKHTK